jgi:hypothetical protein
MHMMLCDLRIHVGPPVGFDESPSWTRHLVLLLLVGGGGRRAKQKCWFWGTAKGVLDGSSWSWICQHVCLEAVHGRFRVVWAHWKPNEMNWAEIDNVYAGFHETVSTPTAPEGSSDCAGRNGVLH